MAVFSGNGSAGSPSFTFSSDTNTGLYSPGGDQLALSVGGSAALNFSTTRVATLFAEPTSDVATLIVRNNRTRNSGNKYGIEFRDNTNEANGVIVINQVASGNNAASMTFRANTGGTGGNGLANGSEVFGIFAGVGGPYLRMSASTGGIQFNGDTSSANALDDYEEGTWTPVLMDSVSTVLTVSSSQASYVKVGRMCTIYGTLTGITSTAVSSVYYINNLPFNARYSSFGGSTPVTRGGTVMIKYSGGGTGVGTARTYQSSPNNCEFITTITLTELYFTITYTTT